VTGDLHQRDLDPDVRFLLANERTLLAWLRTGIAIQAGGVAVFHLATGLDLRQVMGLVLLTVGMVCHVVGWYRFRAADRAIRRGVLPARGRAPDLVVLTIVLLSFAVAVALVSGRG
jgi:putative membrane protein